MTSRISKLYRNSVMSLFLVASVLGVVASSFGQAKTVDDKKNVPMKDSQSKRDPFWPVGYEPRKGERSAALTPAVSSTESSWNEAMKKVVINGVSSSANNEYFAVINGAIKSIGDTVSVKHGSATYTWVIDTIEPPASVKLRRVSVR